MPCRVAVCTISVRLRTSSLSRRLRTWNFTVASEISSRSPISRLLIPTASSFSTWFSRSVSTGPAGLVGPQHVDHHRARVEHTLPAQERPHRRDDLGGVGALAQEPVHAQAHGPHHQVAVAGAGEHEDPDAAVSFQQPAGEVEPGAVAAEVEVEHDEVGRAPVGQREGVAGARGLPHDDEVRVRGEELTEAEPDDGLAVDEEQAGGPAGSGRAGDGSHRALVEQGHANLLAASAAAS